MSRHWKPFPTTLCVIGLSLLLSATVVDDAFGNDSTNAGDEQGIGKQLYYDHGCYACHGYNGIGKHNIANDVSGIMSSEEIYLTFLRARSELNPPLPSQKMPHYPESSLSDEKALQIYAYIKTFKDTPPEVDDASALRAILDSAEQGLSDP